MPEPVFHFKRFSVRHDRCAVKVGTDALLLGGWTCYAGAKTILDIGTGSGVLALIAAQRNGEARIDAIEIDDAAAEQAAGNFAVSPWSDRLRAHRLDVRRMATRERYDLILCNPPYYEGEAASPDDRKRVAKHGGELSLTELLNVVAGLLSDRGRFSLILPTNREDAFIHEAFALRLHPTRRFTVHYVEGRTPKRVLVELSRGGPAIEEGAITVAHAEGAFTAQYRTLLKDLLIDF